jgi:hypothetical protein
MQSITDGVADENTVARGNPGKYAGIFRRHASFASFFQSRLYSQNRSASLSWF